MTSKNYVLTSMLPFNYVTTNLGISSMPICYYKNPTTEIGAVATETGHPENPGLASH